MATFTLHSRIKIGNYKPFNALHDCKITKSLNNSTETAVISIPASAMLKESPTAPARRIDTARQFKRGDPIKISLGYNDRIEDEFEGFVSRVVKSIPCELECEGWAFQLHNTSISRVYRKVKVRKVLEDLIEETDIILGDIEDIDIDKLDYINFSRYEALNKLKSDLGNAVSVWMDGKVLHCKMKYTHFTEKNKNWKPDVVFRVGYNHVREGQLKERQAGDADQEVLVELKDEKGKKRTVKAGVVNSNQERKKLAILSADNTRMAKKIADELYGSKNYNGVDGDITGFLYPVVKPGMKLKLIDDRYPELSGSYLVEDVVTTFGTGGARRKIKLSLKL